MPRVSLRQEPPRPTEQERAKAREQIELARWTLDERWKIGGVSAVTEATVVSWRSGRQRCKGLLVDIGLPLPPEIPAVTRILGGNPDLCLHRAAAASGILHRADLGDRAWLVMASLLRHVSDDSEALLGGNRPVSPAGHELLSHGRCRVPLHLRGDEECDHDWEKLDTSMQGVPVLRAADTRPCTEWPWRSLPVNIPLNLTALPASLRIWSSASPL